LDAGGATLRLNGLGMRITACVCLFAPLAGGIAALALNTAAHRTRHCDRDTGLPGALRV
jgi:hypothetical protein